MVFSGTLPKSEASLAERPLQAGLVMQALRGRLGIMGPRETGLPDG